MSERTLTVNLNPLRNVRKKMNAPLIHWEPPENIIERERLEFVKTLETRGVEGDFRDITPRADGLYELNGEQIVIYIKDNSYGSYYGFKQSHEEETPEDAKEEISYTHPINLKKFHMLDCGTITAKNMMERMSVTILQIVKMACFQFGWDKSRTLLRNYGLAEIACIN